jgi:hypothetical protein
LVPIGGGRWRWEPPDGSDGGPDDQPPVDLSG